MLVVTQFSTAADLSIEKPDFQTPQGTKTLVPNAHYGNIIYEALWLGSGLHLTLQQLMIC